MKLSEQILTLYKVGDELNRDIINRDLETSLGSASIALAHLCRLGALVKISEEHPLRYRVTKEAESIHNEMIEERKLRESTYLEKMNAQKAQKYGLPTIKWVQHATSNFSLMVKLPTEPYDSLVRTVRGNH